MEMPDEKVLLSVSESLIESALIRGRHQESIYGHNTGHFSLTVEKENTIIGSLGELLLQKYLIEKLKISSNKIDIQLCNFGSQFDISIQKNNQTKHIHVKSGLWKKWPLNSWEFGIHSDQNIQNMGAPLVLISFLKSSKIYPELARIEGYITSDFLKKAPVITKGSKFPTTGVISRTDNIVTKFSDYQPISSLIEYIILEKS